MFLRVFSLILCSLLLSACDGFHSGNQSKSTFTPIAIIVPKEDTDMAEKAERYLRDGKTKESIEIFEQLHIKYPTQPIYMIALADGLVKEGMFERASHLYSNASKHTLSDAEKLRVEAGMAGIQLQKGRLSEAESIYHHMLEQDAGEWRAANGLGIIASLKGRPEEAAFFLGPQLI